MQRENRHRAGHRIRQPEDYEAFIPSPLPPDPPLVLDNGILDLLSQADRALGRLDGSTEVLPQSDLFVYMYVRKEAVLSSQIEGTQASLTDLLEHEAREKEARSGDVGEISNYIAAMNHGLQRLKHFPLSLRLIREIHAKLLEGTRGSTRTPGEFRKTQNWIGPAGCVLAEATHVPPPPHEMMITLGDWERFVHDETPMPILIRLGLLHAQFETIHPFLDGNGRVGRLLITFLLCQKEILQRPLLYLSIFFKRNRQEYYDRLQAIRDRGDWEGWIRFFLRGIYEVSQEATETARRIVALRERHREQILNRLGGKAPNGLKLLEVLYRMPYMTVSRASEEIGVSFAAANSLARSLREAGLLAEVTAQRRNRLFRYEEYLKLFGEGTEEKETSGKGTDGEMPGSETGGSGNDENAPTE
ncbi:filamentation induced by cAMP protein Fic [Aminomonas paucivorans DSM 12260]|uniref:Filamentation induced by cAMP protein Fic n=1 Tax=Aminomonas paucivorans DSM 12260 TaxID=584708 RepID=E3D0S5_9BACT|nr:Fic family protein [Aminomonas paucivorans]EFQ24813.1 filamentation induced by cAMP protein Fic [Aminomonas paucivorans DSM 12260]